jgi:lipopolysaccharide transport system permease protein
MADALARVAPLRVATLIARYAPLLVTTTRLELAKRYAGSLLGLSWFVLQPLLLLGAYLFVYLVVFRVRFPGFSQLDYVLYVFCGLVPYLGFMEGLTSGTLAIRQNMHLVKNVMLPVELLPVRNVLVATAGQVIALGIVLVLVAWNGMLGVSALLVPVHVVVQFVFVVGLALMLSAIAVIIPDVSYVLNIVLFLLMFLSPIGFRPEMVPQEFQFVVQLNPMSYMIAVYRDSIIFAQLPALATWGVFVALAIVSFVAGSVFFRLFRGVLLDLE